MLAVISVAISLIAISCNSSDPSTTDGNVTVESGINGSTVSSFKKSGDRPQGGALVSSLRCFARKSACFANEASS